MSLFNNLIVVLKGDFTSYFDLRATKFQAKLLIANHCLYKVKRVEVISIHHFSEKK